MVSFTIKAMTKLFYRLKDWFSLDTRSLAVARVALGVFIFIDMLWRLGSVEWHYSDLGVMPRDVFISQFAFPWSYSFHLASGSTVFAALMLGLHGVFAVLMAIGYRTRLMTFLVALFTISLHNRNWYLNNGGDDVIRALMFLLVFIPWGEMFSVDTWKKGQGLGTPRLVSGTWVLAWYLQAFVIYFVSYILKISPIWRSDYTAIYYSSHLDIFATSIGRFIRQYPSFMKLSTIYTIVLEWLGPLMLVMGWALPCKTWRYTKLSVVFAFWALHLGIIATMSIGLFPFYCLGMWSTFIPGDIWTKLSEYLPGAHRHLAAFMQKIAGTSLSVQGEERAPKVFTWLHQLLGGFIFCTIFFWNLSTLKPPLKYASLFWQNVARWTHLYQEWNMFAPFPKQENMWMEMPAELEDGSTLELMSGDPDVHSSKQAIFPSLVRDEHWRKYLMNLSDNEKLARHYGGAWCRLWNRPVKKGGRTPRLRRFSINVFHHVIQPDYQQSPLYKRTVWNHWCFEGDFDKQKSGPAKTP